MAEGFLAAPGSAEFAVALLTTRGRLCPHNPKLVSSANSGVPSCLGFFYQTSNVILLLKISCLCKKCYDLAVPDGYNVYCRPSEAAASRDPPGLDSGVQWWQFRPVGLEIYGLSELIRLPLQTSSDYHCALQLFSAQCRPFYMSLFHTMGKFVPKSSTDKDMAITASFGNVYSSFRNEVGSMARSQKLEVKGEVIKDVRVGAVSSMQVEVRGGVKQEVRVGAVSSTQVEVRGGVKQEVRVGGAVAVNLTQVEVNLGVSGNVKETGSAARNTSTRRAQSTIQVDSRRTFEAETRKGFSSNSQASLGAGSTKSKEVSLYILDHDQAYQGRLRQQQVAESKTRSVATINYEGINQQQRMPNRHNGDSSSSSVSVQTSAVELLMLRKDLSQNIHNLDLVSELNTKTKGDKPTAGVVQLASTDLRTLSNIDSRQQSVLLFKENVRGPVHPITSVPSSSARRGTFQAGSTPRNTRGPPAKEDPRSRPEILRQSCETFPGMDNGSTKTPTQFTPRQERSLDNPFPRTTSADPRRNRVLVSTSPLAAGGQMPSGEQRQAPVLMTGGRRSDPHQRTHGPPVKPGGLSSSVNERPELKGNFDPGITSRHFGDPANPLRGAGPGHGGNNSGTAPGMNRGINSKTGTAPTRGPSAGGAGLPGQPRVASNAQGGRALGGMPQLLSKDPGINLDPGLSTFGPSNSNPKGSLPSQPRNTAGARGAAAGPNLISKGPNATRGPGPRDLNQPRNGAGAQGAAAGPNLISKGPNVTRGPGPRDLKPPVPMPKTGLHPQPTNSGRAPRAATGPGRGMPGAGPNPMSGRPKAVPDQRRNDFRPPTSMPKRGPNVQTMNGPQPQRKPLIPNHPMPFQNNPKHMPTMPGVPHAGQHQRGQPPMSTVMHTDPYHKGHHKTANIRGCEVATDPQKSDTDIDKRDKEIGELAGAIEKIEKFEKFVDAFEKDHDKHPDPELEPEREPELEPDITKDPDPDPEPKPTHDLPLEHQDEDTTHPIPQPIEQGPDSHQDLEDTSLDPSRDMDDGGGQQKIGARQDADDPTSDGSEPLHHSEDHSDPHNQGQDLALAAAGGLAAAALGDLIVSDHLPDDEHTDSQDFPSSERDAPLDDEQPVDDLYDGDNHIQDDYPDPWEDDGAGEVATQDPDDEIGDAYSPLENEIETGPFQDNDVSGADDARSLPSEPGDTHSLDEYGDENEQAQDNDLLAADDTEERAPNDESDLHDPRGFVDEGDWESNPGDEDRNSLLGDPGLDADIHSEGEQDADSQNSILGDDEYNDMFGDMGLGTEDADGGSEYAQDEDAQNEIPGDEEQNSLCGDVDDTDAGLSQDEGEGDPDDVFKDNDHENDDYFDDAQEEEQGGLDNDEENEEQEDSGDLFKGNDEENNDLFEDEHEETQEDLDNLSNDSAIENDGSFNDGEEEEQGDPGNVSNNSEDEQDEPDAFAESDPGLQDDQRSESAGDPFEEDELTPGSEADEFGEEDGFDNPIESEDEPQFSDQDAGSISDMADNASEQDDQFDEPIEADDLDGGMEDNGPESDHEVDDALEIDDFEEDTGDNGIEEGDQFDDSMANEEVDAGIEDDGGEDFGSYDDQFANDNVEDNMPDTAEETYNDYEDQGMDGYGGGQEEDYGDYQDDTAFDSGNADYDGGGDAGYDGGYDEDQSYE
jgi:hypothetical protein